MNKKRTIYYDWLRAIAIFAVVFLHIAAANFFNINIKSIEWHTINIYDSLVRWCVPIFVMLSGALFLSKKEISIKKIYQKNIFRVLVAFFAWSFIYYLHDGNTVQEQFMALFKYGKIENISKIILGYSPHLWFIPMIIGLYICTPMIKEIVKNKKLTKYFLITSSIFCFIIPELVNILNDFLPSKLSPINDAIYNFINSMPIGMLGNYIFYYILGYELSIKKIEKDKRQKIYILGVISYLFTVIITIVGSLKIGESNINYYNYTTVNVALESIALFVLFKNIKFTNPTLNEIVNNISKYSFGIYLVHLIFINHFYRVGFSILPSMPYLSIPITSVFVFILSYLVIFLIDKIPFINKYVI